MSALDTIFAPADLQNGRRDSDPRRVRRRKARRLQRRHRCPRWTGASDAALREFFAFMRTRAVRSEAAR